MISWGPFVGRIGRSRPVRPLVATVRLMLVGVLTAAVVVPAGFFLLPVPARSDGVTLCLPAIGPLQQFAEGLDAEEEVVARLHEGVHAEQCRRLGAVSFASLYWRAPGRIELEAEAICAEFDVLIAAGADPARLFDQTVEALHGGYRNRGVVPMPEVRRIVERVCTRSAKG